MYILIIKIKKIKKMRPPGLEPGPPTWKVRIIPLDYGRFNTKNIPKILISKNFPIIPQI